MTATRNEPGEPLLGAPPPPKVQPPPPTGIQVPALDLETIPPDEELDPMIGSILGEQYRIIERLGAGGMGTVYLVTHIQLKKKFAAKILNDEARERPDALARFQQEAVSASRLDHDNIVNIVNFGHEANGHIYLIMEFLRGEPLNQVLNKGRLGLDDVLRIAIPVCRGLGAAHDAGIVHRDLKPENVFVSRRSGGRHVVKLLDFGISKIKEPYQADQRLTQTGDVLGSPLYMSPEASRGDLEIDGRADIYAVGVMLYEMCTARPLFTAENYLQVLYKHISEPPPHVRDVVPELPEAFEAVVQRALAKDPADRYQTCAELEAALVAAVPGVDLEAPITAAAPIVSTSIDAPVPVPSTPAGNPTPLLTPGKLSRPPDAGTPRPQAAAAAVTALPSTVVAQVEPRRGRSPFAMIAGFTGTLGMLGFAAYLLWQMGRAADLPVAASPAPPAPVAVTAEPPPAPPAASPSGDTAPAVQQPMEVTRAEISITSQPPGATALLDGASLGPTPVTTWVMRDERDHELRLELPGHRPERRVVRFDRSRAVEVALRKVTTRKEPAPLDIKEGR